MFNYDLGNTGLMISVKNTCITQAQEMGQDHY